MERGSLSGWPEEAPEPVSVPKPDLKAWGDEPAPEKAPEPEAPIKAFWETVPDLKAPEPAKVSKAVWEPLPPQSIESRKTKVWEQSTKSEKVGTATPRKPLMAAAPPPRTLPEPSPASRKKFSLQDSYKALDRWMTRANSHDIAIALQQLSVMMKAGINPTRTLMVLAEQSTNKAVRMAFEDVTHQVLEKGWSLSDAMSRHPRVFPAEVQLLARAGEETGDLADRLQRASDMLERKHMLICRVRESLTSPMITSLACLLVLFGITKFVLPRFLGLYDQMDAKLPLISKIVVGLVATLNSPAFLVSLGLVLAFVLWRWNWLQQKGFDLVTSLPITRNLVGSLLAVQFVDILATMNRDGIPLQRGLQLMKATSPYDQYSDQLDRMSRQFEIEGSLAEAVSIVPYFPRVVNSMLMVGEETGELDGLLSAARRLLEQQNEIVLTQLVTVIEPAVIGLMGVAMGILCVGMFLPIYGLLEKLAG
ncbi:MAG: hypothetical protein AMXMBFR33_45530 [Candidatus Xenobia bacterium]